MKINLNQNIKHNNSFSSHPKISFGRVGLPPKADRSIRQTYKKIISELKIETPKDIKAISKKFGQDERIALYTMNKLTTFSNYQRLYDMVHINFPQADIDVPCINKFLKYFKKKLNNPRILLNLKTSSEFCLKTRSSLMDFFHRGSKKDFDKSLYPLTVMERSSSKRRYIFADTPTLDFLKRIQKKDIEYFQKVFEENDIRTVVLDGYNEGITPFNHSDSLYGKTKKILNRAKKLLDSKKHSEITDMEKAVDFAVNEKTISKLKKLGITNFKVQKLHKFNPNTAYRDISLNLMPKFPKYGEFARIIKKHFRRSETRENVLELINKSSVIYSPKTFAQSLKKLKKDIEAAVPCAPDKILYYIPNLDKSYGAVMLHYKTINKIPDEQIIRDFSKRYSGRYIVVLDDMLISGSSTISAYQKAKDSGATIIMAHLLNDEKGFEKALKYIKLRIFGQDDKIVKGLNTRFLVEDASLNQKLKRQLQPGFKNYRTNICFPYMSPDTNNSLFDEIADKFLFH